MQDGTIYLYAGLKKDQNHHGKVCALSLGSFVWEKLNPVGSSPAARDSHSAVFMRGKGMLVFGGNNGDREFNDLFLLEVEGEIKWTRLEPRIASGREPVVREGHSA